MLSQDIAELNQFALNLFASELSSIPLFISDVDTDGPNENATWCRFAVNPDMSTLTTVGQNPRYLQRGSAVLQIMQPRNAVLAETDLNAWEIADKATVAARAFGGSDDRITIQSVNPQRIPSTEYLQVNLLMLFNSQHI